MTSHSFKHCSMDWTKASSSSSSSPAGGALPSAALAASEAPAFPPLPARTCAAATAAGEGPSLVIFPLPASGLDLSSLASGSCPAADASLPGAAMEPGLGPVLTGPVFLPLRMSRASSSVMCCSRFAALKSLAPPPSLSSTCHRDLCSSKKVSTPSNPLSSGRACKPQTLTFMPIFRGSSGLGGASAAGAAPAATPLVPALGFSAPAVGAAAAAAALGAVAPASCAFFWKSAKALKEGIACPREAPA
mmetsp:Transcript_55564/g.129342  ORF Transcript_55564/g.129342 Transcript_55564/m.129342 type:complete len:247 (-) Transcript_55564:2-742(-)